MKLRYLFSAILASALMFVGCVEESYDSFENIKLEKTYLTIPADGGEVTLSFKATTDWEFAKSDEWPNVVTYEKDDKTGKDKVDENGNKVIKSSEPSWLTLKEGPMNGSAGDYNLVFSAEKVEGGREIEIQITAGTNAQYFRVRQGSMLASEATVKEVFEGPDGKNFRVQGVCTSIASTYYGNWYLQDGTNPDADLYIYGTKDADGQYNWESFDIEVGDSVMVEGPKTTYKTTVELVDVSVVKVIKSLIKIVVPEEEVETGKIVAQEGASFELKLAYKGNGVFYTIPDEYKSWVSVDNMTYKSGVPTKIVPNPADTAIVTITALENQGPSRTGKIEFSSSNSKSTSKVTYSFSQSGLAPISDVLKLNPGDPAMVAGTVMAIHGQGFIMADETASIYVYTKDAPEVTVGNNVVIAGTFDNYYGTLQVKNISIISNDDATEQPEYPSSIDYTNPADAANLPKYSADNPTDYPYVKVKGSLEVGEYGTYVMAGEAKVVLYKSVNDYSSLNGKDVVAEGYMMGYNSKYGEYQMIETSVSEAEAGEEVVITPIKDVTASEETIYNVEGVVVAASAKAYVIADATGNLLVYGSDHGLSVLQKVRLTGTAAHYKGYPTNSLQLTATETKVFPSVTEYAYNPTVLTAADLDARVGEDAVCEEVQFEGRLTISGNYVNIVLDGGEYQGSLYYIDAADYEQFKEKNVVVKGYVTGTHNYLNVLPYSVVEK